jgi:hypothetical protein
MLDPFLILAPILLLLVVALLGFVGCAQIVGLQSGILYTPVLKLLGSAFATSPGKTVPAALNLNTTNCNLIVLVAADYEQTSGQSNQDVITDSINGASNYKLVNTSTSTTASIAIWCLTNAQGGNNHGISVAGRYTALAVLWDQYADSTNAVDQSSIQSNPHGASITLPSIIPAENGSLIVTGVSANAASFAVDSGFTVIGQAPYTGGQNAGLGVAYLVQATSGAVSPTWTTQSPGTGPIVACIASFK